jgi:hypothetical protein
VSSQDRGTINQQKPSAGGMIRDDAVDIDLLSREEIEAALKYLKNYKAAGGDSIAAKLLKNGGPIVVDPLHEVTSQTLPRSWTALVCQSLTSLQS